MKVTLELSMYPLTERYEDIIIDFILRLRRHSELEIDTNGMSTQVIGEYAEVMKIVNSEIEHTLKNEKVVVNLKLAGGERRKEGIPKEIQ